MNLPHCPTHRRFFRFCQRDTMGLKMLKLLKIAEIPSRGSMGQDGKNHLIPALMPMNGQAWVGWAGAQK